MGEQKKALIVLTFLFSLGAITLVVVSLATDHWVESNPKSIQTEELINRTGGDIDSSQNDVNFGLFKGSMMLNYGFSPRPAKLEVACEASAGVCMVYSDKLAVTADEYIALAITNRTDEPLYELGLFNYGYWVTTIICAALSTVFGLISMGFAVFNVCGKPIETLTGPMGLYLWNFIAFLFSLIELIMFLSLFLTTLKKNYLYSGDIGRFNTEDYTNLGYSFYLVAGATILYLGNIILLFGSGYKLKCSFMSAGEKALENDVILY